MVLSVGIVGLPNVGKSTFFNALTKSSIASAENYPFCTIDPNHSIVPVPDDRLQKISNISNSKKIIHAQLEFVDIAGLVKGASKGEGLGNKFLDNIRNVDAIIHLTRCFDDNDIIHVNNKIDPIQDIKIINSELILADMLRVEKALESLEKRIKLDKKLGPYLVEAKKIMEILDRGEMLYKYREEFSEFLKNELQLLTLKPMIYVANVDDSELNQEIKRVKEIEKFVEDKVIVISAKIEQEIVNMESEEDREMFLEMLGNKSGLDRIIERAYEILNLISYFTSGIEETRAWTIKKGCLAPEAAGVIHSDFQDAFIRAEVIDCKTFITSNGWNRAKSIGKVRTEGKEYVTQDGDIMLFLHNK